MKVSQSFELTDSNKEIGKVWINDKQFFNQVSLLAWNFNSGGYQPAQKWLKDRQGTALKYDDILEYQKIITALEETDKLMKIIDDEIKI